MLAAFAAYSVITAAITYPLIRVAGSAVSHPSADPLLNTWILWWNTRQLPLTEAWWNAPMFYPSTGAMGLSELLLGILPITAPVQWLSGNPLLAYNVAVLLSFPLCGIATYALAFELTGRHDAAWLAGLVFAFDPYRANEFGHLQMLSYYWAPVALLALHRYMRQRRPVWLVMFAVAWLLQGLCNGHAILQFPFLIVLWIIWFGGTAAHIGKIGLAWACGTLPLVPILLEYQEIHGALHLRRGITDIVDLSVDLANFLNVPPELVIWGRHLPSDRLPGLFPGITVLLILLATTLTRGRRGVATPSRFPRDRVVLGFLALTCLAVAGSEMIFGPWRLGPLSVSQAYKPFSLAVVAALGFVFRGPAWRKLWQTRSIAGFYMLALACMFVLSFGPAPHAWDAQILYKAPYAWFMPVPGFDAIRVPARFAMLATLCLAIVAALAFARWSTRFKQLQWPMRIALSIGLLADGWFAQRFVTVSSGPQPAWEGVAAVMQLPLGDPDRDAMALYRSIGSGVPLVNGYSGYSAPQYPALTAALGEGHMAVLNEVAAYGSLGIVVDRSEPGHARVERDLAQVAGASPLQTSPQWATFVIPRTNQPGRPVGQRLLITGVRANRQAAEAWRAIDGDLETAWGSGRAQGGDEELTIELEKPHLVSQVVLRLGSNSFGFPRDLVIDTSIDGAHWTPVWRGQPVVETVRAALQSPGDVPVLIEFGHGQAAFVRLRQLGREPNRPWLIAEVSVHGPVAGQSNSQLLTTVAPRAPSR